MDKLMPARHHPRHFVEQLRGLAATRPSDTALVLVTEQDGRACDTPLSYADLDQRVRALAASLQARFGPGERALLLMDNDAHYVTGFLACLYAGVVAVPVYPPPSGRPQHLARLMGIVADAGARCVLTSSAFEPVVAEAMRDAGDVCVVSVDLQAVDALTAAGWRPHEPCDSDMAFLQYTSGSTSTPKGVMVTHGALMANERAMAERLALTADDVWVSWLPLYHDMGLIAGLLLPLYCGIRLVLMSPRFFLERPARWLEAIARHRGTISGAPDFAYRLCMERIDEAQMRALDLSSWTLAFSGAEPVRHDTLEGFASHAAAAGFDASAFFPCYGLAEATLFVSGPRRGSGLVAHRFSHASLADGQPVRDDLGEAVLVGCGHAADGHELRIADAASLAPCADGRIGEIWFKGASLGRGYWNRREASADAFVERDGGTWLRTGDLGFMHEGHLYVAGRSKDLIIVRGHNVYPQDIERAVETDVEAIRKGRSAAFAVSGPGGEGIGVAVEVSPGLRRLIPDAAMIDAVRVAVGNLCGQAPAVVLLLEPGALPKTSSGKLQRSACREGWRDGSLAAYASFVEGVQQIANEAPAGDDPAPRDELEEALASIWRGVLKLDGALALGSDAHFFLIGGNSLSATQAAARVARHWDVDFDVRQIFDAPRLGECAQAIRQAVRGGRKQARVDVPVMSEEARAQGVLLSPAQRRQWFLWHMAPQSDAYHVSVALRWRGQVDREALQAALHALAERHESLRTVFKANADGLPEQWILPVGSLPLRVLDASTDAELDAHVARTRSEPFDLTWGPLARAALIVRSPQEHVLLLAMHHIVTDGASMQILIDELALAYEAHRHGAAPSWPVLRVQYADHAAWMDAWLASEAGQGEQAAQLAYWRARLGGDQPVMALQTDHPRLADTTSRGARLRVQVPQGLATGLRERADGAGATVFMALLAAFQALLHKHTGQEDIRVGVPIANRHRPHTEGVVGFFVNTLVLRSQVDGRLTLQALLRQVRERALEAQAHQDLPFEQLVDALSPARSASHAPLFQVMFNHLRQDGTALAGLGDVSVDLALPDDGATPFELVLDSLEQPDGRIALTFTYAADLFDEDTIGRMAGHYLVLLVAMVKTPDAVLSVIDMRGDDERRQIAAWSGPDMAVQAAMPVHRMMARQAARHPDAVALMLDGRQMSHGELDARANLIAHRLIEQGVRADGRVGLLVTRGFDMVAGLLGILKAGAAYVPLDPDYPADRLSHMMKDSGMAWLVTQSPVHERVCAKLGAEGRAVMGQLKTLMLDVLPKGDGAQGPALAEPDVALDDAHLAYVIYTSGSTGKPKGVAVSHGVLAGHVQVAVDMFGITAQDRVLQFATLNFDGFVEQLYPALCQGASVVLRGPQIWDAPTFERQVREQGVTVADLTTAYWFLVTQHLAAKKAAGEVVDLGALRVVHAGGEAMPPEGLRAWRDAGLMPVALRNTYGPTEAAVTATMLDCAPHLACLTDGTRSASVPSQMPLGQALPGRALHVVDADLAPVPIGVAGELCIGGALLARGYIGKAGLSASRFVADPFGAQGERLYRTGDMVRWRADGRLEFLGRSDHQVKVRGFRVEPGEIEACLLAHPDVREAVVVARDGGVAGLALAAYVTPQGGRHIDAKALRAHVSRELPDYMVPSDVVALQALPLNPNGKVDRLALPAPVACERPLDGEAPVGEMEATLASLWAEVLGCKAVGRHDNFFELGGHSLAAIRVTALLSQRHGLELPVRHFFDRPTVAELALRLNPDGQTGGQGHGQAQARQQRLSAIADLLNEFEAS